MIGRLAFLAAGWVTTAVRLRATLRREQSLQERHRNLTDGFIACADGLFEVIDRRTRLEATLDDAADKLHELLEGGCSNAPARVEAILYDLEEARR